jgi:hypothetical protein
MQQILLQMTECHVMPFEGFRAMPDFSVSLQVLLDRPFNRQALTSLRRVNIRCGLGCDGNRTLDDLAWVPFQRISGSWDGPSSSSVSA